MDEISYFCRVDRELARDYFLAIARKSITDKSDRTVVSLLGIYSTYLKVIIFNVLPAHS
ncbi:hypothetical protein IQ255_03515 [Pleurocapsales cyanobacterium LEGE 10410]|nr:hypothetical protein [Pleurocapsales cyanobacterium LEGE 10410]